MWKPLTLALVCALSPAAASAQDTCKFICEAEFKIEPTFTIENLGNRHRTTTPDGVTERAPRERVFEMVLATDMATKLPWFGITVEAITSPFSDDNTVELEFESNFQVITEPMTRGWVSAHFDVVDQFSPADRPDETRAYTHKLDFEFDTAFHLFNFLPEGRWLRGLELETSLDYLATGTPKQGDVFEDGTEYLDDASKWSLSVVLVVPIAPF